MRRTLLILAGAALVLNGCTMIPKYTRPALPVSASWPETVAAPGGSTAAGLRWQEYFTDPHLRSVIELALANNRDLRIAALNIEKAQAIYRIQRSNLYPGLGAMASAQRYKIPEKMPELGPPHVFQQYTAEVGVPTWELDLFGRLRSLKAAALEQYFATEQARSATQISLVGAVAGSYLTLAADAEQLKLARATLEAQQASLDLIQRSRDLGIASDLDVSQARSQVDAARAEVAAYTGVVALDRDALDFVAGATVAAELLPDGWEGVQEPQALAPGLPSDVLLRRPDILMAEHQLRAANANIGAARADFFPRITLTAAVGSMSDELSKLLGAGTGTWNFNPQIVWPLFASGSLRSNLKAAQADRDIAVAQYEKAIQAAFREVSDALSRRAALVAQRSAQESLVQSLDEAYRLSQARYRAGLDGYLGVLVAQRALLGAQQGLINTRLAEQANLVTLYKVLGGGA